MVQIKIFTAGNVNTATDAVNTWLCSQTTADRLSRSDSPAAKFTPAFVVLSTQIAAISFTAGYSETQILITYEDGK